MTKRLALIIPLLLFVTFVAVAIFGLGTDSNRPIESQMIGQAVPDFDLQGLDAQHPGLSSQDLRQGTVTLVNLFGSWCLPCRVEAPQLERLSEAGIVIHGIAIRDEGPAVTEFLTRYGDPFRRIGMDPRGRMQIELGASGVPETFLIDGTGVIRRQWIGVIREEQVDEIIAEVERLQ
jgi:cytochrome c biogenesis protein CcmG/thiol:disulfide interchange protein DsbE|tara:strand:- start:76445 stop:76975 length:531 start_codon:yes stop_codon:yes gene_type:complete